MRSSNIIVPRAVDIIVLNYIQILILDRILNIIRKTKMFRIVKTLIAI